MAQNQQRTSGTRDNLEVGPRRPRRLLRRVRSLGEEAAQQIQKYGLVFKSPSGYPMPSPYLAILHTALDQMRAFLTEFGLSPASRSRVRVANPKQRDLFDDFLDGDEEAG